MTTLPMATRYLDGPVPRLFAHRGSSMRAPENTLESFALGLDAGASHLEFDVHPTSDKHIVVLHDERVDRTTSGKGLVHKLSLRELKSLDAGARFNWAAAGLTKPEAQICVPTLAEVLEAFPNARMNIEIKQGDERVIDQVISLLSEHGAMPRTLLAAEDAAVMAQIRARCPDALTGFSAMDVLEFLQRIDDRGYRPRGHALQVPPMFGDLVIVSPRMIERAHELGLEVHVWTLNTEDEVRAQLALGVDGIMSDDPAMAARVMGKSG